MALAGVIIGSVAIVLSVFAAGVALFQLQRLWRFRRPVFVIESADFEINRSERDGKKLIGLDPGRVVFNARGASRPFPLVALRIKYPHVGNPRVAGGFGSGSPPGYPHPSGQYLVELPYIGKLPAESWSRFQLLAVTDAAIAFGSLDEDVQPPESINLDLYFESPEEEFPSIPLALCRSGTENYVLDRSMQKSRRSDDMFLRPTCSERYSRLAKSVARYVTRLRMRGNETASPLPSRNSLRTANLVR